MKVSLIELSFDNLMHVINPWNVDFDDLTFYVNQRLIAGQQLYCVNDDTKTVLTMVLLLTYARIKCKKNRSLGRCIDRLKIEKNHVVE